eukprot:TRINITY_DN24330_c0_g1_i1.p1 TRINITY_DN24330_c0_g1~~TRINITY_DN24330_c0_g1_i1.p1  ORF type:complete len:579 (+),score=91.74 TRINITY_DN24330_c0_g1_i1:20-1756(+)
MASPTSLRLTACRRNRATCLVAAATIICGIAFLRHSNFVSSPQSSRISSPFRARARYPQNSVKLNAGEDDDWRDFRARLVKQESIKEGRALTEDAEPEEAAEGWAYESPLIESGSLLLTATGDQFAISQQYFHKTVIFIVEHTDSFTRGVILNRPTAFNTTDLDFSEREDVNVKLSNASDAWPVWCGGDCQGFNSRANEVSYSCLHTVERFANISEQIIKGVFMIDLVDANDLVSSGKADKDDFLLLVGYCGWAPDQLQSELDRGGSWTLAAADRQALLGRLSEQQADLAKRLKAATERKQSGQATMPLTAEDVGDGIDEWRRLYEALGLKFEVEVQDAAGLNDDEKHTDLMLHRWIESNLIPAHYKEASNGGVEGQNATGEVKRKFPTRLEAGAMLRGSPTAWLLGTSPTLSQQGMPAQYLHKSVVLLANGWNDEPQLTLRAPEPILLVLLTGPLVGRVDGDGTGVYFGGPMQGGPGGRGSVYELGQEGIPHNLKFQGFVSVSPQELHELLEQGFFEVVEGSKISDVLSAPVEDRWRSAGGRIDTLVDAAEAKLGDVQQRKWYNRFLGIEFPAVEEE